MVGGAGGVGETAFLSLPLSRDTDKIKRSEDSRTRGIEPEISVRGMELD